jgi:hypothetical protein
MASRDGYFVPDSVIRRVGNAPLVPFLGGGPAVLLQVARWSRPEWWSTRTTGRTFGTDDRNLSCERGGGLGAVARVAGARLAALKTDEAAADAGADGRPATAAGADASASCVATSSAGDDGHRNTSAYCRRTLAPVAP